MVGARTLNIYQRLGSGETQAGCLNPVCRFHSESCVSHVKPRNDTISRRRAGFTDGGRKPVLWFWYMIESWNQQVIKGLCSHMNYLKL